MAADQRSLWQRVQSEVRRRWLDENEQEFGQILVRVVLAGGFAGYLAAFLPKEEIGLSTYNVILAVMCGEMFVAIALLLAIYRVPRASTPRRLAGMLADYTTMGTTLALGGAHAIPMFAALLWVTVGNGIRYGTRFLYLAVGLAFIVCVTAWTRSLFWQDNPFMSGGLTLTAVVVPLYIATLLNANKRMAEKFRLANEAKNRFLAQMSHEFRTPLNGIMGMSHLLMTSKLPYQQQEAAELIHSSSQSLLLMVEDVLDVAAIEAGKVRIHTKDFSPQGMLRRIEQVMRTQAAMNELTLEVTHDPEIPAILHGDQEHLTQVLLNMMHNAVKFTRKGGVSLHASVSRVTASSARIKFSVRDTGVGVLAEDRSRIFQPFEQGRAMHSAGGIGLGISIAKTLTQTMGGEIGVEENPGGGSHFWVEVPLGLTKGVPDPDQKAEAEAPDVGLGSNVVSIEDPYLRHRSQVPPLRILVVDDQPANCIVLQRILERAGHSIILANNGEQALDMVDKLSPDLIALDLHMPELNGVEVMRSLRVMEVGRRVKTPVIMLSADATPEALLAMEAAGAVAFMPKPINVPHLLDAVASYAQFHPESPYLTKMQVVTPAAARNALTDLAQIDCSPEFLYSYVAQAFLDIGNNVDRMRSLAFRPDEHEMREVLHAIRGVARNIAADQLANACREWMDLEPGSLREQVRSLPSVLNEHVTRARAEVAVHLQALTGQALDGQAVDGQAS